MTKKYRFILYLIFVLAFILKEEIYGFLIHYQIFNNIENNICEIKNNDLYTKYTSLVNAYQYDDTIPYTLEYSKVLYRDIYNLNNEITIYKGTNQGISIDNLVINELGLVGIITKTNENSSVVTMLENNDIQLSVKINNNYGILKYYQNNLVVEGITTMEEIPVGALVYTSDISKYPADILIGTVSEVEKYSYDVLKRFIITPSVSLNDITYVSVIKDLRGEK